MWFKSKKKRVLSVFSLVMINIIAIDSLRNLPTNAANGLVLISFYGIAILFFLLPSVLLTAELATHYPKTGGSYVWVREAFGKSWAFLLVWLFWIYNVVWYPTILSFIAASVAYLFNPQLVYDKSFMMTLVIGMFIVATVVNSYGMKASAFFSDLSAILGTVLPMIFIIGLGLYWVLSGRVSVIDLNVADVFPRMHQLKDLAFLVIVFFSLFGFEMSSIHAEEVENPKKDYPRALFYSSIVIVISVVLSSLAIAVVVPKADLSLVSGLNQAFSYFLSAYHLQYLMPIVTLLIILGGFGGMAAWVIGPTKSLMVAAQDGLLPKILGYQNKKGAPIAVLILQAVIVIMLSLLFLFFKSINTSYWILSDLTVQLALIYYIIFFAAAIRLRYKRNKLGEKISNAYRVPGKEWGIWVVGVLGIFASIVVLILGFLPPAQFVEDKLAYELILIAGMFLFILPPILICRIKREKRIN